ncbi:MAG: hypothetical protein JRM80_11050 [Nitrososphaerota archaeon]|nr:hypothetical protein [Nitrososphaerota archaeon]
MRFQALFAFLGIGLLLAVPLSSGAMASTPTAHGLDAAFWKGTFFGATMLPWPGCTAESTPPAGSTASAAPTATEIDPNINHDTNNFHWDETSPGFYVGSTQFYKVDYSVEWTGYVTLQQGTTYFKLTSDDASWLYINPTSGSTTISPSDLVVNDNVNSNGLQAPASATGQITVSSAGTYAIEVDYFESCDSQSGIDLSWTTAAGGSYSIVPSSAFTPAAIGSNTGLFPPPTPSVPEFPFGLALLMLAVFPALLLLKKKALPT